MLSANLILLAIFALLSLAFVLLGIILVYHFGRYTVSRLEGKSFLLVYFLVGLGLLASMLGSLLVYLR